MPRTKAEIHARHRQIRELYATGQYSRAQVCAQFGLSRACVQRVLAPKGDEFDTAIRVARHQQRWRKLTDEQVREIRARYQPRIVTARMLAEEYGVSRVLIDKIVQNRHRPQTS